MLYFFKKSIGLIVTLVLTSLTISSCSPKSTQVNIRNICEKYGLELTSKSAQDITYEFSKIFKNDVSQDGSFALKETILLADDITSVIGKPTHSGFVGVGENILFENSSEDGYYCCWFNDELLIKLTYFNSSPRKVILTVSNLK